jgi:hypothetical protein
MLKELSSMNDNNKLDNNNIRAKNLKNIFIGFLIDKGKNWSQMKWIFKFSLEQMKTKLISENIKNEKFKQCSKFSNWQSFFQITKPLFCQQSSVHRYFFLFTFAYSWLSIFSLTDFVSKIWFKKILFHCTNFLLFNCWL